MTRKVFLTVAVALLAATLGAQEIHPLAVEAYALEGGSLRLNAELAGEIVDAVLTESALYLSVEHSPEGPWEILRWEGGATLPYVIQGSWRGQRAAWHLRASDGLVVAWTRDGCVPLLGR
jgi:hypothetical protein